MNFIKAVWKSIKAYFADANGEYRLAGKPLPELYKLKSAHQELLQAYAESLAAVSRLSFFVKKNEVEPSSDSRVFEIFRMILWSSFSPLRLLIWRPIVWLYFEIHIYKKVKELEKAYTLASYLVPDDLREAQKTQDWLDKAQEDCKKLLTAIGGVNLFRDTIRYLLLLLVNTVFVVWGANNLSEFILYSLTSSPSTTFFTVLLKIAFFILFMLPFALPFIEAAFSIKRTIFSHINAHKNDQQTVYELENNLFEFLGMGKTKEFPIDFAVTAYFYAIPILFVWSLHVFITESAKYTNTIVCDISWCLLLPLLGMFVADVIAPWFRRARKGDM